MMCLAEDSGLFTENMWKSGLEEGIRAERLILIGMVLQMLLLLVNKGIYSGII